MDLTMSLFRNSTFCFSIPNYKLFFIMKNQQPQNNQNMDDFELKYKSYHTLSVILVGDPDVGKTSCIARYARKIFPAISTPTIGVQFTTKCIKIKNYKVSIKAQLWDTSGSQKYRAITTAHYRKAAGALLIYDLTNLQTFKNCKIWIKDIKEHTEHRIKIMLLGNKLDLITNEKSRKVSPYLIEQFVHNNELMYGQVSALSGKNLNQEFERLIQSIYDDRIELGKQSNFRLNSYSKLQQKVFCCNL